MIMPIVGKVPLRFIASALQYFNLSCRYAVCHLLKKNTNLFIQLNLPLKCNHFLGTVKDIYRFPLHLSINTAIQLFHFLHRI